MKIRILKEDKGLWHGVIYDNWHQLGQEYFYMFDKHSKWRKLCKNPLQQSDKTTHYQVKITCPDCLVKIDEMLEAITLGVRDGQFVALPPKNMNKEVETTFECRGCGIYHNGTPSSAARAGWRSVSNIDGPNLVCPACAENPETIQRFVDDGYLAAKIEWQK